MNHEFLKTTFQNYNFDLTDNQISQFELFFKKLIETNRVLNLTAITDEKEVVIKHFLDSVLPANQIPQNAKLVDVGSGAGFPAIPLKILRPDLEICMIDSLNKRINFLNEVIFALNLQNITAIHARAEDFAKVSREKFDIAVARAVANVNTLAEYLLPLVKVGGKVFMYKSSKLNEEMQNSGKAIQILGGKVDKILHFKVKENEMERNVLILSKVTKTPQKYPRDKNKPKTQPLT